VVRNSEDGVPKVLFVSVDGTERAVDVPVGDTVMNAAVQHGIAGVVAECGGNLSCATCHVYVRAEYLDQVGPPAELEDDMLDLGVDDRREGSRLSCQIVVTDELDELTVDVPGDN
jgi:ferredoxin, 2Fe-2S